ncbi:MAG: large repetitive protein, partial [Thermoleophilaceae bacterium]|nr:large repetitive protein [Thermoleophilaceae bacterium]
MHPDRHHRRSLAGGFASAVAVLAGLALAGPAGAAALPATTCTLDAPTNTRTCELYAQTGTVNIPPAAQATLSQGTAVSHDAVVYTAVSTGPDGNDVTISYTAASPSQALVVHVVDLAIEVQLATDVGGLPTSTASDIAAAVNADAAASALVIAALPAGDPGTGIPTPIGPTHLAGGSQTLPVWAFGETSGAHPTRIGGPTLVAISGETLKLILHNEIPGEEVNVAVPQQPA